MNQVQTQFSEFRLPGAADRTAVVGGTGTGKTTLGAWILSKQRFDKRPWVCIDFKDEELWDLIGDPPMRDLKLGQMPGKRGLYRLRIRPDQDDELDNWLWKIWAKENVGLFCDECSLMPKGAAFKAILRQGRSKRIPVIACSQRPVDVDREVWTESQFVCVFRLDDIRDKKIVQGFSMNIPVEKPLPEYWSYWYDKPKNRLTILQPGPKPEKVATDLKQAAPYSWFLGT
jgi:hypothetical protein